jgi:H/ACA ribonucleoprotein complex subunit 1
VHALPLPSPPTSPCFPHTGKVDEILGPINEVFFTVKMSEGMLSTSFKKDDKVYIGGDKLLPIERFLPKPKAVVSKADSESAGDGVFGSGEGLTDRYRPFRPCV